jgi:hypothetical protein
LKLFVLIFRTTQGVFAEPKFENQWFRYTEIDYGTFE